MNSLLFLIVVVVMVIFVYKVLIEPLLNPKKEKRSSNYIVEDDEYVTDSRIARTTQISANLSPELYKRLNTYCENNNITKTSVINKAVDKYLDEI